MSLILKTRQVWARPLFVEFASFQTIAPENVSNLSFLHNSQTGMSNVAVNVQATESIQLKKVTEVVVGTNLQTVDVEHGMVV